MRSQRHVRGFTLIELVAVIVLLGMVGLAFVNSMVYGVQNYLTARDATALAQKARLALTRMYVELAEIKGLDPARTGSIDEKAFYYLDHDGNRGSLRIQGDVLLMNGRTLVDNVAAYGAHQDLFTYLDENDGSWSTGDGFDALDRITVELRLTSPTADGATSVFTFTVNPRWTTLPDAPRLE